MTNAPQPFGIRKTALRKMPDYFLGSFFAMGCPCEVLIESADQRLAQRLLLVVRDEAWRIEAKWSRYLKSSLVQKINHQPEKTHTLDEETRAIVDYGQTLWQISEGRFDITSGVYRRVWSFDGTARIPSEAQIDEIRSLVGWHQVVWIDGSLTLQPEMQIDFGGLGKEYAVDACCRKITEHSTVSCLVNFGGDCAVTSAPVHRAGWTLGIESIVCTGSAVHNIELRSGGVATSGNVHRFVLHKGKRLSHVIDARTGWPISDAPQTVTVQSSSCMEAGALATLACLQGKRAEHFLIEEAPYWIQW